ncbi:ribonuclease H-like domain-containing protein [Rhodofomes roseus]|uniref:ribonuclease H n=1 Tax=Rhodofomes roseus TaxID=34475 RepID=A0ABQ8K6M1_9APHY|nr:ribonuclease H-like domain-containing protein [Rhodofomes roseus]KAH9832886.1 ribonuclease H-like domain-containing protein [Rhodofomes roseus]
MGTGKTAGKPGYYAVAKGHTPGVYLTWDDCLPHVNGFPGATYKKFTNVIEAEAWIEAVGEGKAGSRSTAPTTARPPISRPAQTSAPTTTRSAVAVPSTSPRSPAKPRSPTKPVYSGTESGVVEGSSTSPNSKKRKRSLAGQPVQDETGWQIVYSDGACKGNGKVGSIAGIGVWWGHGDERNLAERCPGAQTNNRAELIAIVRVLETTPHDRRSLLIKTDSQYSINCFQNWLPGWEARKWINSKGEPVKNKELIRYLSALLDQRALEGQKVRLQYVRGHVGEEGNEGADWLANIGVTRPERPERDWETLRASVQNAPAVDLDPIAFAKPEVLVPPEDKNEFEETSQKLFSVDADVPISGAELEAYASALADDDDLLWDLEDD